MVEICIFLVGLLLGIGVTYLILQKSVIQNNPRNQIINNTVSSCTYNGKTYKNGEGFRIDCNSCTCENGQIGCTEMACDTYK